MSYIILNINARAVVAAVQVQHAIIGARCCAWLPLARYNNNGAVGTGARRAAHCSALNENRGRPEPETRIGSTRSRRGVRGRGGGWGLDGFVDVS